MPTKGALQSLLEAGEFVVTAEITPKLTASPEDILAQALPLRGLADAVNVTDGAGARVTMSSLAASALLVQAGIEPVLQMTCRDRNRIAIAADLIGASALGIRNLLALSGDDPKTGDEPEAKPVFDLGSKDIMSLCRSLSAEGKTTSGRALATSASLFVGAADAPFDPPADWQPTGLLEKNCGGHPVCPDPILFSARGAAALSRAPGGLRGPGENRLDHRCWAHSVCQIGPLDGCQPVWRIDTRRNH